MTLRERVWEDLAADLEYHPKRALLYLALAVAALGVWVYSPSGDRLTTVPLVFAFGGVALLLKGVFLLRKSSEGLALTQQELDQLSAPSNRKILPPFPILAARIIQDFGTGALLLGPVMHMLSTNESRELPNLQVFLSGAILAAIGWLAGHFVESSTTPKH
jgi:hypothetical protein